MTQAKRKRSLLHHPIVRTLIIWAIHTVALLLLAWIMPGLEITNLGSAALAAAFIGLLNALLWPLLTSLLLPFVLLTLGTVSFFINMFLIWLSGQLISGFEVSSFWSVFFVALGLSLTNALISGLLTIDDENTWYRHVLHRHMGRESQAVQTDVPGLFYLEIDGLAKPILEKAISKGDMPNLASWLESGSHKLVQWEPDLSSQTSASQAGILQGSNYNIPAFRWYDRQTKAVVTSGHPKDLNNIEKSVSNGDGLLVDGGVSRGNIVSGDATRVMATASMGTESSQHHISDYYALFINPYNVTRLMTLAIADFIREKRQYRRARKDHVEPILGKDHRGGTYPFIRIFNTTIMPEINVDTLIGDLFAGAPVAYSTFVAYDEVAHHSGIESPDAYDQLTRLDNRFARVAKAVKDAPRPYHLVVLSDHGQTNGATFKQRYGLSLGDLVKQLAVEHEVTTVDEVDEGRSNLNFFLTDFVNNDSGAVSKTMGRMLGGQMQDGQVLLGSKNKTKKQSEPTPKTSDDKGKMPISVLASGNLGMIYGTDWEERATMEKIEETVPGLIDGLAQHEGIGFVFVHSEEHGGVVIGAKGRCYLDEENRVEGEDPLTPFEPNAADHLRRNDGFPNAPDIYVNSFYDPETNEGCAFEELIGFHGGIGGTQTQPFILHPVELPVEGELVGAASVYKLGKGWLAQLQGKESS